MKYSSRSLIILTTFNLLYIGLILPVSGQTYTMLEPTILLDSASASVDFGTYLKGIFSTTLIMAVVLAIVMLTVGGIEYVASSIPGAKEDGKNRMKSALLGLAIALSAWALLNTVNPELLKFDENIFKR